MKGTLKGGGGVKGTLRGGGAVQCTLRGAGRRVKNAFREGHVDTGEKCI